METKVKSREWVKTAAIIFLAVLLVLTFFSNTIMNASLPEVAAQQTKGGAINAKIRGSGTLSANETYDVTISQTRKIASVKVREGQTVNAGDVLFILEAEDSEEVRQAQDQLAQMELNYEKSLISAGNESAQENHQIEKARDAYNEALAVYNQYSNMEPSKLIKAQAQAEASLKQLQKAYQKAQEALTEAESDEEYLDAQSEYQTAKAELEALEQKVKDLNDQISDASGGNKQTMIQQKQLEKQQLEKELKKSQAEAAKLQQTLSELETANEIDKLTEAVSNAEKALSEAKTDTDYLLFLNNVSSGDSVLMGNYRNDKTLLTQRLIFGGFAAADRADSLADTLFEKYDQIDAAEKNLTAAQEALTAAQKNLEETQAGLDAANAAASGTTEQIAAIDEALKELNSDQTEYADIVKKLQNELTATTNAYQTKNSEMTALKRQLEAQKEAIKGLKDEAEAAKDQMDAQQDALDSLNNASGAAATVKSCEEALEELIFQQGLGDGSYLDLQAAKDEIEKQKENIEKLMQNADEQEVTAKVGGVISTIYISAGNTIGAESPLATINLVDRGYTIKIPVTTEQAKKVKVGDKAELLNYWGGDVDAVLESLANDPNNPGKGKLLVFRLTGDVEPNQNYTLSIGQKSAKFDCLVPNSAVRSDNNGSFVLVLVAKSTPLSTRYIATRADVQILASDDTSSAVSGLSSGDFVITTSTKPIEAGTQVRLVDNG